MQYVNHCNNFHYTVLLLIFSLKVLRRSQCLLTSHADLHIFFFSYHNTFPRHCSTRALAQELYIAKWSGLQGSGRRGQSSRCSVVWRSSPQSHLMLAFWPYHHLCIKCLQHQTPVLRRLRHCQIDHGSRARYPLGSLDCRCVDQSSILLLRSLPSRCLTARMKLFLGLCGIGGGEGHFPA